MQGLIRCRVLSSWCGRIPSTSQGDWCKTSLSILQTFGIRSGSEFKVTSSGIPNCNENRFNGICMQFLRSISTRPGPKTANAAGNVATRLGNEVVGAKGAIQSESALEGLLAGKSDSQEKTSDCRSSKPNVNIFVMDIETSGYFRSERIIEIAIRDLSGGEDSCFHTLVNPESAVNNSKIHGITTDMVNQQHLPRMEDLIPTIIQFIDSRQKSEGPVLFLAHNGFRFDFRILLREFNRCSIQIPNHWRFLDTLPLGYQLVQAGLKPFPGVSLEILGKHYNIQQEGLHRAMPDVNLLTEVFLRLVYDLELSEEQLLEKSLDVFQLNNRLRKPSQKSKKK